MIQCTTNYTVMIKFAKFEMPQTALQQAMYMALQHILLLHTPYWGTASEGKKNVREQNH